MQDVFTTGQVARIAKVAPRTVSKWFDSGRLEGYRIPGSRDRRVPREQLIRFLKRHGMPLGELASVAPILLAGLSPAMVAAIDQEFATEDRTIAAFDDLFGVGMFCRERSPGIVVLSFGGLVPSVAITLAKQLRSNERFKETKIIAIVGEDEPEPQALADSHGFAAVLQEPVSAALLIKAIHDQLGE